MLYTLLYSGDSVLYSVSAGGYPATLGLSVLTTPSILSAQLWQGTRSYESRQKWPTVQKWSTRGTWETAQDLPFLALSYLQTVRMERKSSEVQYLGKTEFKLAQNRTKKISIDVRKDP